MAHIIEMRGDLAIYQRQVWVEKGSKPWADRSRWMIELVVLQINPAAALECALNNTVPTISYINDRNVRRYAQTGLYLKIGEGRKHEFAIQLEEARRVADRKAKEWLE